MNTDQSFCYDSWRNNVFVAQIDMFGRMKHVFDSKIKLDGCLFVLCTRGECRFNVYNSRHTMKKGSMMTFLPNSYVELEHQSPDCRLYIMGFDAQMLGIHHIFSTMISYIPFVFEAPIIELNSKAVRIVQDYIVMLIRANSIKKFTENREFVSTVLHSFIYGLASVYKVNSAAGKSGSRSHEITRNLIKLAIKHYKTQRSPAFYAEKLHITPQHLSTTVSKVTSGKVTDIIARLVILDAQAKLRSTDMSVQEIADSLNFPSVSFFGKYFKRYTGLSPRAFRDED